MDGESEVLALHEMVGVAEAVAVGEGRVTGHWATFPLRVHVRT